MQLLLFSCMTCGSGTKKLYIRRLITYCTSKCPSVVPLPISCAGQASYACLCSVCCVSLLSLWSTKLSVMLWSVHMQSPRGFKSISSDCTCTDHLPDIWYFLEASALAWVSWSEFRYLWHLGSWWRADICVSVLSEIRTVQFQAPLCFLRSSLFYTE